MHNLKIRATTWESFSTHLLQAYLILRCLLTKNISKLTPSKILKTENKLHLISTHSKHFNALDQYKYITSLVSPYENILNSGFSLMMGGGED
jgi:hypothetical protein